MSDNKFKRTSPAEHHGSRTDKAVNATYDPLRDGDHVWESEGAKLMGDPPIGRRAIDSYQPPLSRPRRVSLGGSGKR